MEDALQPGDSRQTSNKEVEERSKEKITANLSKDVTHINKGNSTRKELGELEDDSVSHNVRLKPGKERNNDKSSEDINLEWDGFFDDFDAEDNFGSENVQNTPPDSEFTGPSHPQPREDTHHEETCNKTTTSNFDFRARILQTLQMNKSKNSDSSSSNMVTKSFCATNTEKRKLDCSQDLFSDSLESSNKRITTTLNKQQETESPQDSQDNSFFPTSVKPAPVSVRKSVSPGGPVVQKRKFPGPAGILPQLVGSLFVTRAIAFVVPVFCRIFFFFIIIIRLCSFQ